MAKFVQISVSKAFPVVFDVPSHIPVKSTATITFQLWPRVCFGRMPCARLGRTSNLKSGLIGNGYFLTSASRLATGQRCAPPALASAVKEPVLNYTRCEMMPTHLPRY